ncbi:hypothetical protein Sjap_018860 [Stephania japonica]|uniref:Myb-like domain-containing protein n=1 Tax=Stephania japonica TaxID=461633 RepID=A0AAP0NM12_9MAGN
MNHCVQTSNSNRRDAHFPPETPNKPHAHQVFDKMPHRNHIERRVGSALRRSPRFLRVNSPSTQKTKSKSNQESRLPSSCPDKPSSRPPLRSIQNALSESRCDGSVERFGEKLENSGKSSNGSRKSEGKVEGVEWFRGLRRSPRFSNKENVSESVWKSAQLECRIALEAKISRDLGHCHSGERPWTRAAGRVSSMETVRAHEVVVALLANEVLGAMDTRRADCSAVSPVKKLELSRANKRKNVGSRVEDNAYKGEMPQCKNTVGALSGSDIGAKKSMECSSGSGKSTGKVKQIKGIQGLRWSPRFSNASSVLGVNTMSSKCEDKTNEAEGENCTKVSNPRGRSDCSAVSPAKKMELSGGNKRKDVDSRVKEDAYKGETLQCRKNVIAPCGNDMVGGTKKSMECSTGSGKSTGKVVQGSRWSRRFSSVISVLGGGSSKGEEKTSEAKGESDVNVSDHASVGLSVKGMQLEVLQNSSRTENTKVETVEGKAGLGFNSWKEGTSSCDIVVETPLNRGREKSVGNINSKSGVTTLEQVGNQFDENVGCEEWTEEQEAALQRAYFAARPSPHFWKKVAKLFYEVSPPESMVPGKSAQECFDRIHSSFPTPPQRPPRSRAKKIDSPPSLSGSKLLEPIDLPPKRLKRKKEKRYVLQKTARLILQKHSIKDQGYEADLFSIFESTTNSSTQALVQTKWLATPDCSYKRHGFLQQCQERSLSSSKRKPLSRLNNSSETRLASPPVLKPVKNMKLHEKYIDQLHRREAARRVEGRKYSNNNNKDANLNPILKTGIVQAAKENLVSDAKDIIYKFQDLQANAMSCSEDSDEEYSSNLRDDQGDS